jgi:hypothetical protein
MPSVFAPLDFSAPSPAATAALNDFAELSPATTTATRRAATPVGW